MNNETTEPLIEKCRVEVSLKWMQNASVCVCCSLEIVLSLCWELQSKEKDRGEQGSPLPLRLNALYLWGKKIYLPIYNTW